MGDQRKLRNFIRDRITQVTLGTFVATFVYSILALVSIGPSSHGEFVPHLSITVTMGLGLVDVIVLVCWPRGCARAAPCTPADPDVRAAPGARATFSG